MPIESDVIDTLRDPRVRAAVDFSWWCYPITPEMLERVADYVETGRILVHGGSGTMPSYYSADDSLTFTFDSASDWVQKAAIVHEATHAACDIAEYTVMTTRDSECAEYLAQCLAGRALCEDRTRDIIRGSGATRRESNRIFDEAWGLAELPEVSPGYRVSRDEGATLRRAVCAHRWYREQEFHPAGYDGIARQAQQAALSDEPFRPRTTGALPSSARAWDSELA